VVSIEKARCMDHIANSLFSRNVLFNQGANVIGDIHPLSIGVNYYTGNNKDFLVCRRSGLINVNCAHNSISGERYTGKAKWAITKFSVHIPPL